MEEANAVAKFTKELGESDNPADYYLEDLTASDFDIHSLSDLKRIRPVLPVGHYDNKVMNEIYEVISKFSSNDDVIEIGSYLGKSTVLMSQYAILNGLTVHCIDPFFHNAETWLPYTHHQSGAFLQNLDMMDILKYVKVFPTTSNIAMTLNYFKDKQYSVVHLDGDHSAGTVAAETVFFQERTKGFIIYHDTEYPSVQEGLKSLSSDFKLIYTGSEVETPRKTQLYTNL
tara:strand:+ start:674 stop:1360 length:687 start_codon:yes stop_codon:yes gene_type:complete